MKTIAVVFPLQTVNTINAIFVNDRITIVSGDENSFQIPLEKARFDTGIKELCEMYEMLDSELTTITIDRDVTLQTIKSTLTLACKEILGKKAIYPRLITELDKNNTVRSFYFDIYFNDIPLYFMNDLMKEFTLYLNSPNGIMVLSGDSFASSAATDFEAVVWSWYLKESLRDLKDQLRLKYLETKDDFYFFSPRLFMTEDTDNLLSKVYQYIEEQMKAGIFPSRTPQEILDSRDCSKLKDSRWQTSLPVGDYLFEPYCSDYIVFNTVESFYMFLYALFSFHVDSLYSACKVQDNGGSFIVSIRTESPVDYLRFRQAKSVQNQNITVDISITDPHHPAAVWYSDFSSGNKFWLWSNTMAGLP